MGLIKAGIVALSRTLFYNSSFKGEISFDKRMREGSGLDKVNKLPSSFKCVNIVKYWAYGHFIIMILIN